MLADEGPGRQRLHLASLHRRLEAEVEVAQRHPGGQVRQLQRRLDAPFVAGADFAGQQPVEDLVGRAVVLDRLRQFFGQDLGGVAQPQLQQLLAGAVHLQVDLAVATGTVLGTSHVHWQPTREEPR